MANINVHFNYRLYKCIKRTRWNKKCDQIELDVFSPSLIASSATWSACDNIKESILKIKNNCYF